MKKATTSTYLSQPDQCELHTIHLHTYEMLYGASETDRREDSNQKIENEGGGRFTDKNVFPSLLIIQLLPAFYMFN